MQERPIEEIYNCLKVKFGSHSKVAKLLGIHVVSYRGIRNKWLKLTPRTEALVRRFYEKNVQQIKDEVKM